MNALQLAEKHNSQEMEKEVERLLDEQGLMNQSSDQMVERISRKVVSKK